MHAHDSRTSYLNILTGETARISVIAHKTSRAYSSGVLYLSCGNSHFAS